VGISGTDVLQSRRPSCQAATHPCTQQYQLTNWREFNHVKSPSTLVLS